MRTARRFVVGLASAASLSLLFACTAPASHDEDPTDALDSALNEQDFDATVKHLASLPYLPWTYLTDGCYARALYYSMLLATKNVPTNHLYVVGRPGAPPLFGIWSWHVAPLITKDGDPNKVFVLDPAYDQTKALTNVEWVAKQNYPDPSAANYPRLHVHAGTSYLDQYTTIQPLENPAAPSAETYKEPVFSEMPAFAMTDVSQACLTMHRYIDREPSSTAEIKAAKHKALGIETQKLVRALVGKSKISGDPTLSAQCTRNEVVPPRTDGGASEPGAPDGELVEPTRIPVPEEGTTTTAPTE